jgi:hypothetical protein
VPTTTKAPPTEKLDEYNKAIKAADLAITATKAAGDKGAEARAYWIKVDAQSKLNSLRLPSTQSSKL